MQDFLGAFGAYDFLVRESLILLLVAFSIYLLLRAGMFAVPQVGLMGIGGYTAAILSSGYGVPMIGRLVAASLAAGAVALLLGLLLARLDGIYLAIATIGFSEIVRIVARNLEITGGAVGLSGLDRSLWDLVIVALAVLTVAALWRLERTRFGLAMTAMREDALAAAHQGVNLRLYRACLFTASGLLAGLAGGLHIHLRGFIEPGLFSFDLLVTLLTATVIGGMNTVLGPIVGAIVIFSLPQVLRGAADYRILVNGALLVAVVAFAPTGLVEVPRRAGRALGNRSRLRAAPAAEEEFDEAEVHAASDAGAAAHWLVREPAGSEEAPETILAVSGLSKRFGGLQALDRVDLELHAGEVLGLIGPNGSGKTTLLNMLSGVYRPDGGQGTVLGRPLSGKWGRPDRLAAAGVARTFQTIRLLEGHTVAENVAAGAYLRQDATLPATMLNTPGSAHEARATHATVCSVLDLVGIAELADVDAAVLPYGLQRRVEIARALVRGPGLLLLDEPTAGMAPAERDDVFELVGTVRSLGIGVIVVEHDVLSMTANCDRIAVLNFGAVIAMGDPDTVVREEAVVDAYIGRRARG